MAVPDTALAAAVVILSLATFLLAVRLWTEDPGSSAAEPVDGDVLDAAVHRAFADLGVDETVGRIETHAAELRSFHGDIESMLRTPRERGAFGERQLEAILSDHLPPETYGIREQVVEGATPDAHLRSAAGVVCVDAKFPLENYERHVNAADEDAAARHARAFASDVESQLEKVARDYVRPEAGTAPYAFAFVPSEAVYYHLVTEEYDLLQAYTREGVQVVSPLTFGHKLELVRADVEAQRLSEQAEVIRDRLQVLGARFDDVESEWTTLRRHLRNAKNKADEVDAAYRDLRSAFDRVDEPSVDE